MRAKDQRRNLPGMPMHTEQSHHLLTVTEQTTGYTPVIVALRYGVLFTGGQPPPLPMDAVDETLSRIHSGTLLNAAHRRGLA